MSTLYKTCSHTIPQGGLMKVTRAKAALAIAAAVAVGVSTLSPANAATRSTVILHETNPLTALNCGTPDTNTTTCSAVAYLQSSGFTYYNNKKVLVRNTTFGSFKVVKNTKTDYRVEYKVNPGRVWSDGTPITGVDLLLSHVISSNKYSIDAGLGDPADEKTPPAFNSLGYGGTYSDNIVGNPVLSADKMTVTLQYKKPIANWDIYGPGPSAVHALVLLADGKTKLGTAAENTAAKAKFLTAYEKKDTAYLKKIAKVWNESYLTADVNDKTNPLLLISNGGFIIDSAVNKSSVTLVKNPKYNSGPALSGGVDKIIFKFIGDGTAAAQALANGELDVYAGQATADGVAKLKAIKGVNVLGKEEVAYEHWDLRYDSIAGEDPYNGPFAAKYGQKSLDLRTAFLLALPRQEIMDKLITPINGVSKPIQSTWVSPGSDLYNKVISTNGSGYYLIGTQADRERRALALVKKYYPNAQKDPIKINVLVPGNNARRAAEFAIAKATMAKAGFELVGDVQTGWGGLLGSSKYDAFFFAWVASSVNQKQSAENFITAGGNNLIGYSNATVDQIISTLDVPMSEAALAAKYAQIEKIVHKDAVTLGVFIHPGILAVNQDLKGIKPSPLSPQIVWNYWEWTY